ncbi:hypothetical protein IVB40_16045 [Bradyrhizobium sp. 40]|uniref:DUF6932 family protein n=1 Tax=Bradyrhizobium sp. 40 TaxID=2782674 RepID=UPI0020003CB2|nr:hypothetical protein [Bradyrhizobium sp. 40]UPJ45422.1 hypothetical protein IVB40_16045 [Bradyrhizobium sp. 40]
MEELAQELLRVKLSCIAFVDGSFLSEKLDPGDVDVLVNIDDDVMQNLLPEERILIDALNLEHHIAFVDDRKTGAGKDSLDQIASWDERRRKCRREEQCNANPTPDRDTTYRQTICARLLTMFIPPLSPMLACDREAHGGNEPAQT